MRFPRRLLTLLAVAVLGAAPLLSPRPAAAANLVEGYITFAGPDMRYGYASGAVVEIVNAATNQVVDRRVTGASGGYVGFCPAGRFYIRATFRYRTWTLRGTNCCCWFTGTWGRVNAMNVLVR